MNFHGLEIGDVDYSFDPMDPDCNPDIEGYDLFEKHIILNRDLAKDCFFRNECLERLAVNLLETEKKLGRSLENIKWWGKPDPFTGSPRLGWAARSKKVT